MYKLKILLESGRRWQKSKMGRSPDSPQIHQNTSRYGTTSTKQLVGDNRETKKYGLFTGKSKPVCKKELMATLR